MPNAGASVKTDSNSEKNTTVDFPKYLVIFIDLLGTRNRAKQLSFSEQLNIHQRLHGEFVMNQENDAAHPEAVYFRRICTFSDCAYIIYGFKPDVPEEKKDLGRLFTVALCNCEPIFINLLYEHILFRGGVFYGDAYVEHNKNMVFGEAINKAYDMESKIAIHPRIVVDDFVAKAFIDNVTNVSYQIATHDPNTVNLIGACLIPKYPETGDGLIEKDIDGKYIFNYFHFLQLGQTLVDDTEKIISKEEYLNRLIVFCDEQIRDIDNMNVIDKYQYLKRFCSKNLATVKSFP